MHTTIAVAHARRADLLDVSLQTGLIGATRSVMVSGAIELEHTACASDRDIPLTSLRLRPGLRAFGGSRLEASRDQATGRQQSSSAWRSRPQAASAVASPA